MNIFFSELIGTFLLILLGNGVVANVVLNKTKGNSSGWIVITFGWAIAVFVGVYAAAAVSGAHLNPAVTLALALKDGIWENVPMYMAGQLLGAMTGSLFAWIQYRQHFDATENPDLQLGAFCTAPAIRSLFHNLVSEVIGTFAFILGVLFIAKPQATLGSLDALPAALLVLGIGLSLGGTTGYAINPARDLGPRIMHSILPIKGKRDSDWSYSWIPVVGPFIGAILAVMIFRAFHI
ncbi:MIP/aquaporin family protein [Ferruginibacter sp. HRS2-29]|uniref:MIP/aquaporin family protein n=1 Tax=Ferruginibacter sp. HRS2-29 TaxID=2487334 RepID=UPI0020CBE393|nr:MIP/aquaporin family protein [Ferruginibacter sp. HRS2-29]MCP9751903.1 aquaporin family protein [Ferruginibacter sp. HRS2-29]